MRPCRGNVLPLVLRTADGLSLAADAWLTRVPAATAVVLVQTGHRHHPAVVAMAHELRAEGHAVITYDMRGHGESEGLCTLGDLEGLDTGMGHAYGTRGLEPISDAVAWCLGVPAPGVNARQLRTVT